MSDEEYIPMPEYDCPSSFGDALKERVEQSEKVAKENARRFAIYESLSQEVKDKLDQLAGYKSL